MVDEKQPRTLTRQLDAIPSELRAKPLKRRRVRLKPGDDELEKTTNEILSTLANEKVLGTTTRKPLPAIPPTTGGGKSVFTESDWLNEEKKRGEGRTTRRNKNNNFTLRESDDLEDILPPPPRRKRDKNGDSETIFTETSTVNEVFHDDDNNNGLMSNSKKMVDFFTCHNDDSGGYHRNHSNSKHLPTRSSVDLDWLNDNCSSIATNNDNKRTSRRRNGNDEAEMTLQRLISEGESELTNKLALNDSKPNRRASRRTTTTSESLVFEESKESDDSLSQIDGSSSTTTFSEISYVSRPRRRRGIHQADEDIRSDRHYSSDALSDDLSASYDPSMLSKTAPKLRVRNDDNQQGEDGGIFTSPKRHKKRTRMPSIGSESIGNKTLVGSEGRNLDGMWPEINNEKSLSNPPRQSRKTSYRKYLPPLAESMPKTDSYL